MLSWTHLGFAAKAGTDAGHHEKSTTIEGVNPSPGEMTANEIDGNR